ncbi:hypothetical protein GCM10027431_13730 [Lysobacter rhizosphaerae]
MNAPDSHHLRAQLTDIGDWLSAALSDLARDPEPFRCEVMTIQLEGVRRHVLRLAEAISAERGHGQ